MREGYYGHNVVQGAPSVLYRGQLDDVAVVLLPLVPPASLSKPRVADYERRLARGATPTALALESSAANSTFSVASKARGAPCSYSDWAVL